MGCDRAWKFGASNDRNQLAKNTVSHERFAQDVTKGLKQNLHIRYQKIFLTIYAQSVLENIYKVLKLFYTLCVKR